ncbi:hypothetical protein [Streptomyces sp. NPDC008125]|uniref:hypothetical protein n=1 Tax=Streptomyces sp. NPDC008125 TaxID=3364811 RepID=UPI0036E9AD57
MCARNSYGGPAADTARFGDPAPERFGTSRSRAASARTWRHLLDGVSAPVPERAPQDGRDVGRHLGDRVAAEVNGG